jgi:hypothetical protein
MLRYLLPLVQGGSCTIAAFFSETKSGCQRVAPLPPPLPKFTEVLAFNPIPGLHSPERGSGPPDLDTRAFFLIARK